MTESASTPRLRATFAIYLALVAATPLVGPREIPFVWSHLLAIAGFVCVTLACLGRIWCSLYIAGHKDEVLVVSGPYAHCRHPLYSLSILGALGLGFASQSLLLGAVVVLLVAGLVIYAAVRGGVLVADPRMGRSELSAAGLSPSALPFDPAIGSSAASTRSVRVSRWPSRATTRSCPQRDARQRIAASPSTSRDAPDRAGFSPRAMYVSCAPPRPKKSLLARHPRQQQFCIFLR